MLSAALGLLSTAEWYSGNTALLKILAGAVALQPITAIGFILCGAALFTAQRGARGATLLIGAGTGLLGLVTISEYLIGFDLRINEALLGITSGPVAADLARMAPSTALCFLFAGTAFSLASLGENAPIQPMFVGLLGGVLFSIGAIAFAGYLTGLSATYEWDQLNGMALPTAMGFVTVGGGLVALGWRHGSGVANRSLPWLPLFVGVSGLTATLILWHALLASEDSKIHQLIRNQEINVHNRITLNINSTLFELMRSATRWQRFNLESPARIQDEAGLLIQWLRGLRAIGWLDENNRLRWIIPKGEYPTLVGADLSADPHNQAALETARAEGMALIAAPDGTPGSDRYFIYAPISDKRKSRGFMIGIFHAQELFDQLIDDEAFIGYSIELFDGGQEIYQRRGSDSQYRAWAEESLISLGKITWTVRVWAKPSTMAAMDSNADLLALLIGLLATALITAVTYLAQSARRRARQAQAANDRLESEIAERRRAQEQIQLQLERISILREINLAATSTLSLQPMLNLLLETIQRLLPYSALLVWLKDPVSGDWKRAACRNLDEEDWMGRALPAVPKLVLAAAESKNAVVISDIRSDPRTLDRAFYQRNGLISYLGVPLLTKGETLGLLVFLTRAAHEFTEDEVQFLSSVASQAAVAIHNSQLYEKIQTQARALEEANKLQADFTAMIAHDLRSPLSNVIGIAEMMDQGLFGPLSEEQKNWLGRMRNNAKNLVSLVSDFLDVSKLESGRIELHRALTDVADLACATVANYKSVAAAKMIALTYSGDPSIPHIEVDARRLDQVITNLITNAIKFTNEGGRIQVRVLPGQEKEIRIEIQDSGVGIPRAEIAKLFQKYRQADNARALADKGTGLGLVICKMIVEAHGGRIWIDSDEGKGTTFSFTLPIGNNLQAIPEGESLNPASEELRS